MGESLNARQKDLAAFLEQSHSASVQALADQFQVSDETIRRDLKVLADLQLIERFHGGVRFVRRDQEAPFAQRLRTHPQAKAALAAVAAAQIPDGASLVLDNSSTVCFLARALAGKRGLTIMTPSIEVAQALLQHGDSHRILMPPGEVRGADRTIVGAGAIDAMRQFVPDVFVFSAAAVGTGHVCLDYDLFEVQLKQAVLERARTAMLLVDASKYALHAPMRVCEADQLGTVVCDQAVPDWAAPSLAEARVLVAGEEGALHRR